MILSEDDARGLREEMVRRQIEARDVDDPRVLEAMRKVPRHLFVPESQQGRAYGDRPLPIAEGQTISQPYIVALMAQAAEIEPGDRVLEVGAGSGYAAAVLAQIAEHVFTIERHPTLAEHARRSLDLAGIANVTVRTGDGTRGWAEQAPFDAILVAAGAPVAPESLKRQLAVGGRLVVPVLAGGGADGRRTASLGPMDYQDLVCIRREPDGSFTEEPRGAVRFVPLIGAEGYAPEGGDDPAGELTPDRLPQAIARAAEPLPEIEDPQFAARFDRLGEAGIVGLGEATHGTSEFYRARAAITRRLVEQHGVRVVAIEADWPDAARLDRHARHRRPPPWDEPAFTRFPTWMWRNRETWDLVEWLRDFNGGRPRNDQVSLHGLDLYALGTSISAVIGYLDETDPDLAALARRRYGCLSPWQEDPVAYGRAARSGGWERCETAVVAMLSDLLKSRMPLMSEDGDEFLDAEGNARLVQAAEHYYRSMFLGGEDGWNLRDTHMVDTLDRVREARGGAKAVVWAHNSHIGDASATEMGRYRGQVNVGSLCRERHGGEVALLGFGTDRGTVAAASDWGDDMELKSIRPAMADSVEALCRDSGEPRFLLDLARERRRDTPLHRALLAPRLQRAIGVIYRPETERFSHYFDVSLPEQFDLWVWVEETSPVTLLSGTEHAGAPETFPFGL